MLRVQQMMLAQCFVDILLGRDWRYSRDRDLAESSAYLDIVSCFLDSPEAPFSLHRLVDAGHCKGGSRRLSDHLNHLHLLSACVCTCLFVRAVRAAGSGHFPEMLHPWVDDLPPILGPHRVGAAHCRRCGARAEGVAA